MGVVSSPSRVQDRVEAANTLTTHLAAALFSRLHAQYLQTFKGRG